jgi:hypothetical protein
MRNLIVMLLSVLASVAMGQQASTVNNAQPGGQQIMPSTPWPGHDMSKMKGMSEEDTNGDASLHAMQSMEGHMDMGPHMKMTALRPAQPGDAERAQQVVEAARKACAKYIDYHAALADGFKIFHPELPQKMYHFTNYAYALQAAFTFDPEHPTSLLYEKHGHDYKLIGAMYTAPKRLSEDQLNERIPLSIAQWHEHVNLCAPPPGRRMEMLNPGPRFGLRGSITTEQACTAAGGTFHPVVFNWMVHVYPFEKDQASIWSVERQHIHPDWHGVNAER